MEVFFLSKYEPSGKHHNVCLRKLITSITFMVQLISPREFWKGLSCLIFQCLLSQGTCQWTCARRWCSWRRSYIWTRWCSSARLNDPQRGRKHTLHSSAFSQEAMTPSYETLSYLLDCFWQTLPLKNTGPNKARRPSRSWYKNKTNLPWWDWLLKKSLGGAEESDGFQVIWANAENPTSRVTLVYGWMVPWVFSLASLGDFVCHLETYSRHLMVQTSHKLTSWGW